MAITAAEMGEPRERAEENITGIHVFLAVFAFGLESGEPDPALVTRDERALREGAAWLAQSEQGELLGETLQALHDQRSKEAIRMDDIRRLRDLFLTGVGRQELAKVDPKSVL